MHGHERYPTPVCVRLLCVITFTRGSRGEAGAGAQRDDAVHRFQAHNELFLPERPWGRCRQQPVSSLLIERGNKVAAREMLMVLPKTILCF